ncbi:hypothetical protein DU72_17810, partial [Methanosarcina mazei]
MIIHFYFLLSITDNSMINSRTNSMANGRNVYSLTCPLRGTKEIFAQGFRRRTDTTKKSNTGYYSLQHSDLFFEGKALERKFEVMCRKSDMYRTLTKIPNRFMKTNMDIPDSELHKLQDSYRIYIVEGPQQFSGTFLKKHNFYIIFKLLSLRYRSHSVPIFNNIL